ncbi:MAG: hypothetical protein JNN04_00210 [Cyclobacteriaceae bacterium]|nr:hypothetical protein [Cyclobacteriaceae bacterium]
MRTLPFLVFLVFHAGLGWGQPAQWHFGVAGGVVGSFGPSDNQAELVGGQNPASFDGMQHLSPAFKSAATFELTGGMFKKSFGFDGTVGWFAQPAVMVMAPATSSDGPAQMSLDLMNVRLTPSMRVVGKSNEDEHGIWIGGFGSFLFPVQTSVYPSLTTLYGIKGINPSVQFNWGMSFRGFFRIGHSGLFGFSEASITLPGVVGSIGSFQLEPGSSYVLTRSEIKMYSFRIMGGIGYRLGARVGKTSPPTR